MRSTIAILASDLSHVLLSMDMQSLKRCPKQYKSQVLTSLYICRYEARTRNLLWAAFLSFSMYMNTSSMALGMMPLLGPECAPSMVKVLPVPV